MNEGRIALYERLENKRNSKVLLYFTGDRPGLETNIAPDVIDFFVDQLDKIGSTDKITLILYTCGGDTLAAWNIVNLIRQFCDEFEIIVPSKARSAGTLMCLGANEIMMTKQATLGPIDPSVNSPLNPMMPNTENQVPVSVESIKGFLELAKKELSIKSDDALVKVLLSLAEKVHPLVLGNSYRALSQIRMLAKKLILNQVRDNDKIERIISFLCSESGSHDYTIDRKEAIDNLELKVIKPSEEEYQIINEIYKDVCNELELKRPFNPNYYLGDNSQCGYEFKRCILESTKGGSDYYISSGIFEKTVMPFAGNQTQINIQDKRYYEGWKHYE